MKRPLLFLAAAVLSLAPLLAGDLTITFQSKGKGPMGTSQNGNEIHYYSSKFQRINNESTKIDSLVDYEKLITYTINHKKKQIGKMSLEDALAAMEALNTGDHEGVGKAMAFMFGDPDSFKVEPQGTDTVAGRACKKYKITVAKIVMETSNDPSLKPPVPAANFAKMMKAKAAAFAAAGSAGKAYKRLYEEMSKIQGIALKTHMSGMMGMNVSTEATKVAEGPIPASTFALPAGYKIEDEGKKLREQLSKQ